MRHRGFTLTELLVVIAIVLVLTGLTLAGAGMVRRAMAVAETGRRMNEIHTALQSYGAGRPDAPGLDVLLTSLRSLVTAGTTGQPASAFRGVARFRKDTRIGALLPDALATPAEAWPEDAGGRPTWMFAHPWGLPATDFLTDPEGNTPPLRLPRPPEETALAADEHGLSELTPDFSPELLMLAGVLPLEGSGAAAVDQARRLYRSDRRPRAPWNDAWGNPLVVGFAWYHPRKNTTIANRAIGGGSHATLGTGMNAQANRQDLFAQRAVERYGWFRAVYVAIAAIGSEPPSGLTKAELADPLATWTGTTGVQLRIWQAADLACNRDGGGEIWRSRPGSDLLAKPPWTGVRNALVAGSVRLLSAPLELR